YSSQVANLICARLAEGISLREICRADDMPAQSTVYLWLQEHSDFSEKYVKARQAQAEHMSDELIEIADDGSNDWMERNRGDDTVWVTNGEAINRSRLRVDTRKWLMSKMAPKKYGERVTQEISGPDGGPIEVVRVSDIDQGRAIASLLDDGMSGLKRIESAIRRGETITPEDLVAYERAKQIAEALGSE
ncbi:MAG TPA: hypothetical protein VF493_03220, partial [Terriglobales bacterium]